MSSFNVMANDQAACITINQVLSRETGEAFDAALAKATALPAPAVLISFAEATALLSEGIRCLIAARDDVAGAEKKFYIVDLPPDIAYTLRITNLLEFLNHRETLADALKECGTGADQLQSV